MLAPTGVIATPAGALISYHSINRFPPESRRDAFVLIPDGSLRIDPSEGPGRMRLLAGNDSLRIDWAPVIDPLVREAVKSGAVAAAPTMSRGLDQLTLQRWLAGHSVKLVVTEAQGVTGEATQVTLNQIQFLAIVAEDRVRADGH